MEDLEFYNSEGSDGSDSETEPNDSSRKRKAHNFKINVSPPTKKQKLSTFKENKHNTNVSNTTTYPTTNLSNIFRQVQQQKYAKKEEKSKEKPQQQSPINKPKYKRKKNKNLKKEVYTIHNMGSIGAIGGNNNTNHININAKDIKPPKKQRVHVTLANDIKNESNIIKKKFMKYLLILFIGYYRIKVPLKFVNTGDIGVLLSKLVNKYSVRKTDSPDEITFDASNVRFIKRFMGHIMDNYDKSWGEAVHYIQLNNSKEFDTINDINGVIIEPRRHNAFTLIVLAIIRGFSTPVVNIIAEISDSDPGELEREWHAEITSTNEQGEPISNLEDTRSTVLICGISRYAGNGVHLDECEV